MVSMYMYDIYGFHIWFRHLWGGLDTIVNTLPVLGSPGPAMLQLNLPTALVILRRGPAGRNRCGQEMCTQEGIRFKLYSCQLLNENRNAHIYIYRNQ